MKSKKKTWTNFDLIQIGVAILMLFLLNMFGKPDTFDAIALIAGFLLGTGLGNQT